MKFLITIAFASFTYMGFSQAPGFYGKKFMVGTEGFGCIPVLNGFFKEGLYKMKNNELVNQKEIFNGGYGLYLTRSLDAKRSLGLEMNRRFSSAPTDTNFLLFYRDGNGGSVEDTLFARMEQTRLMTTNIMLRYELVAKNGTSPFGFSHFFGLGLGFTSIRQSYSHYQLKNTGIPASEEIDVFNFQEKWPSYTSVVAQYGMSMRYAINRHFAFDIGVKYMLSFFLKPSFEEKQSSNSDLLLDYQGMFYDLKRKNVLNLNIKTGICYVF